MRIGLVAFLAACGQSIAAPAPPAPPSPPAPAVAAKAGSASCVDDGKPYDVAVLRARIEHLASKELDGRAPGTDNDETVRGELAARMRCLGLTAGGRDGSFEQPFKYDETRTANLVGYVKGTSDEIVVVGAHHDHLGDGHLGANDNASGVAAVLAVAQAVQQAGTPKRTIAFVLFGGEEAGLLGSQYFVAHAPAALPIDHVVEYINLDMLGSYNAKRAVYAFGAGGKQPAHELLAKLAKQHRTLNVGIGGKSDRGDQLHFCEQGVPYVFFWTPDPRCYHEKCDTADKVDYTHLSEIASLAGDLARGLADSDQDLAASRKCSAK
jgi:hypothetical protein